LINATGNVRVVDHPLVAAGLSVLRAQQTTPEIFRRHLQELSVFLFVDASRSWNTHRINVQTPLASCDGAILAKPVVLVPILRAGLGMLDGIQRIAPDAAIGHIGIYRDAETLRPVSYFDRVPVNVAAAEVLLLDPMLATGNSACEAASILKAQGATSIQFLCIVACPPGIEQLQREHPDVPIVTAAIDPELDDHGYIVPGLGDAGDRYFGTG
jgi:uracil phosphoribosyltransferase